MNILFFVDADITINRGGVSRVTHFLSREFMQKPGWNCHLAYLYESKQQPISEFNGKIRLTESHAEEHLKDYIIQNKIDIVIVSLVLKRNTYLYLPILNSISIEIPDFKTVFCFHTYPGFELFGIDFKNGIRSIPHTQRPIHNIKRILLKLLNNRITKRCFTIYLKSKYRFIYNHCDKLILLSAKYIPIYTKLAGLKNNEKLTSIPNPLLFNKTFPADELVNKQNEVLVVASLLESSKRISLVLKIWKKIEVTGMPNNWKLTIVGKGEDEQYYKYLSKKLNLKNISFEGWQNPIEYYKRASIFLMTSLYEGWGLTLTESQQMGVVPVAFDSYEALHDIIKNNYNGLIIPDNDIDQFAERLKWLMLHDEERRQMAINSLKSSLQFSMDNVTNQWCRLFEELQH